MTTPNVATDKLPAGYEISVSGSGANLNLYHEGVKVTYAPRYGNGRDILIAIAWALESVGEAS